MGVKFVRVKMPLPLCNNCSNQIRKNMQKGEHKDTGTHVGHEGKARSADTTPATSDAIKAWCETPDLRDAALDLDGLGWRFCVDDVGDGEFVVLGVAVVDVDTGELAKIPFFVTSEPELAAFWYEVPLDMTSANDLNDQPLPAICGKELMNPLTVMSDVSCSRTMRPGLLGMPRKRVMLSWMGCVAG